MVDVERHTAFLVSRLRALGVEVAEPVDGSATGVLRLSATAFESLAEPFYPEVARFYTLGHARLKFFEPLALFDLPALDVARAGTRADIEALLRRSWTAHVRALRDARTRLERMGARVRVSGRGARLLLGLPGLQGPAAIVRGPEEILLPSAGPLARASASGPGARRHRPLRGIDAAADLELGVTQAVERAAAESSREPRAPAPSPDPAQDAPTRRRVLVVDSDAARLSALQTALSRVGLEAEAHQDPRRALEAFRARSFDGVVTGLHLSRMDGFELAARLRELPGVESLPVIVLGDATNAAHERSARELGVEYRVRPAQELEVGEELYHRLAHGEKRRFRRFGLRLGVRAQGTGDGDLVEEVGRLGLRLCTRRDVFPGAVETYTVALPRPLAAVRVEGEVCYRVALSGKASVAAGVRFRRFLDDGEAGWLRMIDALAARESAGAAEKKPGA